MGDNFFDQVGAALPNAPGTMADPKYPGRNTPAPTTAPNQPGTQMQTGSPKAFWDSVPMFPQGNQPATLPDEHGMIHLGQKAAEWAPTVGAMAATALQPELAPVTGFMMNLGARSVAAGLGGFIGQGVNEVTHGVPGGPGQAFGRMAKEGGNQATTEALGWTITQPLQWLAKAKLQPNRMYESALKPQIGLGPQEVKAITDTGLEGRTTRMPGPPGVNEDMVTGPYRVTADGYKQLRADIDSLNGKIQQNIANKTGNLGDVIDPTVIDARLNTLMQQYQSMADKGSTFANDVNPRELLEQIKQVRDEYMQKHSFGAQYTPIGHIPPAGPGVSGRVVPAGAVQTNYTPQPYTLGEAQIEKQATYRNLGDQAYGQLTGAQSEAKKALAHSLREEITNLFPEIAGLNDTDSALIKLEEQLRDQVVREGNKNLTGLIPAVMMAGASAGVGAAAGHAAMGAEVASGIAMLKLTLMALDNPAIKTQLAIMIRRASLSSAGPALRKAGPMLAPTAIRTIFPTRQAPGQPR